MIAAIVVAAGSSRRMGFDKLAAPLGGRSVLENSVRSLAACGVFQQLVLVASVERWTQAQPWLRELMRDFKVDIAFAEGGAERHESVAAGLAALPRETEWVAVHDGARPLVGAEDIRRVVAAARHAGAASLAHPVVETVKRADASAVVTEAVDREGLWAMETPQVFRLSLLREAYQAALARGKKLTDEVSAVQAAGFPVQLVASTSLNLKITHPQDLHLAERLRTSEDSAEKL